jgi:glycine betaine/proline transport system permease protein
MMNIPSLPLGRFGEAVVQWITLHWAPGITAFGTSVTALNAGIVWLLSAMPPLVSIFAFTVMAWSAAGRRLALFTAMGFLLIWNQGLWIATVKTLGLVLTATILSLVLAIPLGIMMAESRSVRRVLAPALDFLQTMPRFVYLIPAVIILGIDVAPAVFATITLAVVPPTRLTAVGIATIERETIEAAESMGCTRWQLLAKVKLPLALPAIMLGVNQCMMMALSMVIIASLIGASGLGDEILMAIALLDPGRGVIAGFAVLVLAIVLDRTTKGWAGKLPQNQRSAGGGG